MTSQIESCFCFNSLHNTRKSRKELNIILRRLLFQKFASTFLHYTKLLSHYYELYLCLVWQLTPLSDRFLQIIMLFKTLDFKSFSLKCVNFFLVKLMASNKFKYECKPKIKEVDFKTGLRIFVKFIHRQDLNSGLVRYSDQVMTWITNTFFPKHPSLVRGIFVTDRTSSSCSLFIPSSPWGRSKACAYVHCATIAQRSIFYLWIYSVNLYTFQYLGIKIFLATSGWM